MVLLSLVSCSSVRYMEIDTYNPATITFPKSVRKVMIVNNALPQQEVLCEQTFLGMKDTLKLTADSTAFAFCSELGAQIAESPLFDDVLLYDGCFRTDKSYVAEVRLTSDEVGELCRTQGADAVISLDRLLFKVQSTWNSSFDTFGIPLPIVQVEMLGAVRAYVPDRETSLGLVLLADTLISDFDDGFDEKLFLNDVAMYKADEVYRNFVPFWATDSRWYYTGMGSSWKEASAYAEADKWDEAAQIWNQLYDKSSSWKAKARLMSNLALNEEINGSLPKALNYATQSYELFRENAGEENTVTQQQKLYKSVLEFRVQNDNVLKSQLR